ncbi:regulatory LuxR family protein [Isoptericola sp. CG 20/1183]|uniref:Regulatory LuxR family protein n=1 Tax=Isoptericola halotolerans TaxID=300560 RepID=A0ABX5ED13_9MICO|nr:regulatory LuxR family protein [Isoptericola sp. CG 20/1183]PRZ03701.1 regulatory LuxR family protein [Isoptericola halotolerans]
MVDLVDLLGRRAECEAVERVLAEVRAGRSGALVVRGEAGIGKTAVLEHLRHTAASAGLQVESLVGAESETQFAFAGLHQLCAPLLDRALALPEPQQVALGVAFGLHGGATPDKFLVGLATLNLLAEAAEDRPLVTLVDDAQWLDQASAQVLAFVARRLAAERVALVFAMRDHARSETHPLAGLPELRLEGLGEADAQDLLAASVRTPLDDGVRDRIVAEARGNPLALLELPRSVPLAQLAGGFGLPDAMSVPRRVEEGFRQRSRDLPAETQLLLLVAAAEPTGNAATLWRAADELGIPPEAAGPAEEVGLLEVGTRVRFRHPLVRSAVYRTATPPDRRRAHAALAAATDPRSDPDRCAWHRAQAAMGTDEEVAAELERTADRARARGGMAAAASFLQHAFELTPSSESRTARALKAADTLHEAGASKEARELLARVDVGPLDAVQRAHLALLRARIEFYLTRHGDAARMLLDAARMLTPHDVALARETYLHALDAAIITGGGPGHGVREIADAARAAPPAPEPPGPSDLLLDGLVATFTQGYAAAVPALRRALEAFRADEFDAGGARGDDDRRWLSHASRTASVLFDDESLHALATRHVRLARDAGALVTLPAALLFQSVAMTLSGELERAGELAAEQTAIAAATGAVPLPHAQLVLAAWRGRPDEVVGISTTVARDAADRVRGTEVSLAQYALAVLHNGLGDYTAAQDAAARACESDALNPTNLALPELIEAACRAGRPEHALEALEELDARARASGTPWALGLAARSRGLVTSGRAAEVHYLEGIGQLSGSTMVGYLARAHLVYGEWLRREGRRRDAREQLRTAHELLSEMGAEAFAERAARELRATGEHARERSPRPTDALTAQELHVARLVATGATSREAGAQLFLSPRTIEAHLRNIFRKLGITSRRQLKDGRLGLLRE